MYILYSVIPFSPDPSSVSMRYSQTDSPRSVRPRNSRRSSCPLSASSFHHPDPRPCASCWAGCRGHFSSAAAPSLALCESSAWGTWSSSQRLLLKMNDTFAYLTRIKIALLRGRMIAKTRLKKHVLMANTRAEGLGQISYPLERKDSRYVKIFFLNFQFYFVHARYQYYFLF